VEETQRGNAADRVREARVDPRSFCGSLSRGNPLMRLPGS
jgi:hypothetical protein